MHHDHFGVLDYTVVSGPSPHSRRAVKYSGLGSSNEPVTIVRFVPEALTSRHTGVVRRSKSSQRKTAERDELKAFLEYGRSLAALRHHHIADYIDTLEEGGSGYLVSENRPGASWESVLNPGSNELSDAVIARLLLPVVRALSAAHDAGIIHHAVSPRTLFLDKSGEPYLTGFVPTVMVVPESADYSFSAPERLDPDGILDCRTDIYSLGACLFWLMTGMEVPSASSRKVFDPVPGMIERRIRRKPVQYLLSRCLEMVPAKRPTTMAAIEAAVKICFAAVPENESGVVVVSRHVEPSSSAKTPGENRATVDRPANPQFSERPHADHSRTDPINLRQSAALPVLEADDEERTEIIEGILQMRMPGESTEDQGIEALSPPKPVASPVNRTYLTQPIEDKKTEDQHVESFLSSLGLAEHFAVGKRFVTLVAVLVAGLLWAIQSDFFGSSGLLEQSSMTPSLVASGNPPTESQGASSPAAPTETPEEAQYLSNMEQGRELMQRGDLLAGDFTLAIQAFRLALDAKPDDADARDLIVAATAAKRLESRRLAAMDSDGNYLETDAPLRELNPADWRKAISYPEKARMAEVGGTVELRVLVGPAGRVQDAAVLSGPNLGLHDAALEGIKSARFTNPTWNEESVRAWTRVTVEFAP